MTRPATGPACATHPHPDWWTAETTETVPADEVREQRTAAAYICKTACPVRDACLAKAEAGRKAPHAPGEIDIRPFGVLGGRFYNGTTREPLEPRESPTSIITPTGRRYAYIPRSADEKLSDAERKRKARAIAAGREYIPGLVRVPGEFTAHGVPGGYAKHRRSGEDVCQPCREVYNAQRAAWSREQRARRRAA